MYVPKIKVKLKNRAIYVDFLGDLSMLPGNSPKMN